MDVHEARNDHHSAAIDRFVVRTGVRAVVAADVNDTIRLECQIGVFEIAMPRFLRVPGNHPVSVLDDGSTQSASPLIENYGFQY